MDKALKRVAFYTLGCKVNQYDSEAMQEQFVRNGYRVVDFDQNAEVYVINTCTVTNVGDRKSRQTIRRAHRRNPHAIIAVVGCYAQRAAEEVLTIPGVQVALGTKNRLKLVEYVEQAEATGVSINGVEDIMKVHAFEETPIESYDGKTRAILKIQEGCSQFCAYCIIPYARGPVRSRNPKSVKQEVERLAAAGFQEVVLTGIHIASYGKDLHGVDLLDLLQDIHEIPALKRIRLGSVEPTLLTEAFIGSVTALPKICRHYHVSLQSGCDETLGRMNRKYTTQQYGSILGRLKSAIPEVSVTTDIMVGFPGETDAEFAQTLAFVEQMAFSKIHVFQFSPREGTPAATFQGQVSTSVKEARSHALIELGHSLEQRFMKGFLGRPAEVLFEEGSTEYSGFMEGYTDHYIKVAVPGDTKLEGTIQTVLLTDIAKDSMKGHILKAKSMGE